MSPTFVFTNLSQELKEYVNTIHREQFAGISLIYLESTGDLLQYFNREGPYKNRNHPAPHIVILFQDDKLTLEHAKSFWNQYSFRKPPVLLIGSNLQTSEIAHNPDLPFSGIVELPGIGALKDFMAELVEYWASTVKLPLV